MNKAKYKGGRDITAPVLYEHWANLYRIKDRIIKLKQDLERDCKAYWKYDELCTRIIEMQKAIIIQDTFEEVK